MRKVLIVDDDPMVREVLGIMLSSYCRIISASNGKEAVAAYRKSKPDIVLMDILMPEMDGITATREIKAFDPDAKIIAITAYASTKGEDMLKVGALDVVGKPIRKTELIAKIEKYLE
ncbi:response regulator [Geoglobus acetivorans]|uniref:Signal transduction response regulator n=1 Tax=Geoglobus acetivorans TaxID=565033 RepID=A0A0A7GE36_GEOAI|nr:Signal transduction response regulator [Geoglobus acetivorans]